MAELEDDIIGEELDYEEEDETIREDLDYEEEDETIREDLDYEEYDLEKELEEALLAEEQESDTELIQPEADSQEEEVASVGSVHSRLSLPPEEENYVEFENENEEEVDLVNSAIEDQNEVLEDEEDQNEVLEDEEEQNKVLKDEEEQNEDLEDEEEEKEEDEDQEEDEDDWRDGNGRRKERDRFKSERTKISLNSETKVNGVIPESLDDVIKSNAQIQQFEDKQGAGGRGRGMNQRGNRRGGMNRPIVRLGPNHGQQQFSSISRSGIKRPYPANLNHLIPFKQPCFENENLIHIHRENMMYSGVVKRSENNHKVSQRNKKVVVRNRNLKTIETVDLNAAAVTEKKAEAQSEAENEDEIQKEQQKEEKPSEQKEEKPDEEEEYQRKLQEQKLKREQFLAAKAIRRSAALNNNTSDLACEKSEEMNQSQISSLTKGITQNKPSPSKDTFLRNAGASASSSRPQQHHSTLHPRQDFQGPKYAQGGIEQSCSVYRMTNTDLSSPPPSVGSVKSQQMFRHPPPPLPSSGISSSIPFHEKVPPPTHSVIEEPRLSQVNGPPLNRPPPQLPPHPPQLPPHPPHPPQLPPHPPHPPQLPPHPPQLPPHPPPSYCPSHYCPMHRLPPPLPPLHHPPPQLPQHCPSLHCPPLHHPPPHRPPPPLPANLPLPPLNQPPPNMTPQPHINPISQHPFQAQCHLERPSQHYLGTHCYKDHDAFQTYEQNKSQQNPRAFDENKRTDTFPQKASNRIDPYSNVTNKSYNRENESYSQKEMVFNSGTERSDVKTPDLRTILQKKDKVKVLSPTNSSAYSEDSHAFATKEPKKSPTLKKVENKSVTMKKNEIIVSIKKDIYINGEKMEFDQLVYAANFFRKFYEELRRNSIDWQVVLKIVRNSKCKIITKNDIYFNKEDLEHSIVFQNKFENKVSNSVTSTFNKLRKINRGVTYNKYALIEDDHQKILVPTSNTDLQSLLFLLKNMTRFRIIIADQLSPKFNSKKLYLGKEVEKTQT